MQEKEHPLLARLRRRFAADILETHAFRGDATVVVRAERLHAFLERMLREPAFAMDLLVDITAVDWPERKPRFDVVYHLYSLRHKHRLRVKTRVDLDQAVDSVTDLWHVANWLEREVWDMFGIPFRGHPDLRRILMYPSFQGHPLRKDYPLQGEQPRIPYRKEPYDPWRDPDRWKEPTS